MSAIQIRQIQKQLTERYSKLIDMSDVATPNHEDRNCHFMTRALAAASLQMLADVEPLEAAKHVIDGGQDQGIDAFLFSEQNSTLYVVQAKWHKDGKGTIALGDTLKTLEGLKLLIEQESQPFNAKAQQLWEEIELALDSPKLSIVLALVHTGSGTIADDIEKPIKTYFAQINDVSEIIRHTVLTQREFWDHISTGAEGRPIDIEVMLHDWGKVEKPIKAIYGRVSASEVAEWVGKNSVDHLLSKNIRKFLADTTINESIAQTLADRPELFWYFNNGLTILCQSVTQKALGAGGRETGVFVLSDVSVVNGAQTAGVISKTDKSKLAGVFVQARFISLENCPPNFSVDVTRATNTQNRVESKDFAALDPSQERLRKEFLVEGRQYLIKSGDVVTDPTTQCNVEEAAIALACANDSIELSTIAKNSIGRIWDESNDMKNQNSLYSRVFPPGLQIHYLWNCVTALREVEQLLQAHRKRRKRSKAALVGTHGNRFLAHQLLLRIPRDRLHSSQFDVKKYVTEDTLQKTLSLTCDALADQYPTGYVGSIFKNQEKCRSIGNQLAAGLPPFWAS